MPDIGDFKDIPVIEVLVKAGDTIEADESIITLESDKATMDVPAPAAGKIAEIIAKVGDKVSMGTLIARLVAPGGSGASLTAAQADEADAKEEEDAAEAPATSPVAPTDLPPTSGNGPALADFAGVHAGPGRAARRPRAGLDLNKVKGTGEKGRITNEDVLAALAAAPRRRRGGAFRRRARCRQFRQVISASSARSRPSRCPASSGFPARICMPPGSTSRT